MASKLPFPFKKTLTRTFDHLEESAMALFLVFMTVLTFVQVVLRYGFNTGLMWSLEATVYSFSWLVLIGMSYGVRTQGHIAANLVVTRLGKTWRKRVALVATGLCLVYAGLLLAGSLAFVDRLVTLGHHARDLPMPRWLLTLILPAGFALLAFRLAQTGMAIARGQKTGLSQDLAENQTQEHSVS